MKNGKWWMLALLLAAVFVVRPFLVNMAMQAPAPDASHCGMSGMASTTSGTASCLSHCVSSLVDFPGTLSFTLLFVAFAVFAAYALTSSSLFKAFVPNLAPYVRQRDPCTILKTIKRE